MRKLKKYYCLCSVIFAVCMLVLTTGYFIAKPTLVYAAQSSETTDYKDEVNGLSITYNNEEGSVSAPIKMLLILTILTLAPAILVMMTSYTRIIIVLHFLRTAIGTQTAPPNQVMIGLALFLTFFIMWPTFEQINTQAIQPLDEGIIKTEEALERAEEPIREFMSKYTQRKDVDLFADIAGETYESYDDVPFVILVPAFIISELREAFIMGFLIYIPFIVLDMVVA